MSKTESDLRRGGFGGGHAIVIGAGTTGLAATAAAARHFRWVTNLERDALPDEPVWRKGAAQSRHVHALLKGGQNVLNHFFPGLTADMVANGAVEVDLGRDIIWHHSGGWKHRFTSGVVMQCQTRGYLEWYARQRLSRYPNVTFQGLANVDGYLTSHGRIGGVRLADGSEIAADLVIDASGRNSNSVAFLQKLGLPVPEISELKVDIGYSTQIFRPGPAARDWKGLMIHSRPPATRTAALMPIEGGRWIATLVGWNGDLPGGDHDSFMAWARGLPVPDFYNAICDAEPVDRVWRWMFPSNLRRHYERVPAMPEGLVVVGDANTSLNPIYGQGMSQGAIGASILDACLQEQRERVGVADLRGLSKRFHRRYARFIDECWLTSTTEDYGVLGTGTRRAWYAPLLARFLHRFSELTWHDERAAHAFLQVMNLQQSPASLLRPGVLWKMLATPRREPPKLASALAEVSA
jgi:2-polyprenyl-6-methoxyphenol hydroxylase-like FAD-dependent oxidoreductase